LQNISSYLSAIPNQFKHYDLKNMAIIVKTPFNVLQLEKIAPFTSDYPFPASGNAYYLCENHRCNKPVYAIEDLF